MKKIITILFVSFSLYGVGQSVTADPALEPMKFTSLSELNINATQIPLNSIIKLKVPILNYNSTNVIPEGTCKIKIGLGSKLVLDPLYNLTTMQTSNFFSWTAVNSGGQMQITGELIAPLPASFSDTAIFNVKGYILGGSTITSNFLVTNHNSPVTLSDENGANNISSIAYVVITPVSVPLTLSSFIINSVNCQPQLKWITENETNSSRFEIERKSAAANNWQKIASLNAQGNSSIRMYYTYTDSSAIQAVSAFKYRLKIIDLDGTFKYSNILSANINCNKIQLLVYPNPVINDNLSFTVTGFSKNVKVILRNATGEKVSNNTISNGFHFINVSKFSNGYYVLSVQDETGNNLQSKIIIQK